MSPKLQHSIIRASAGSGKTYQLANRYIALLLLQAAAGPIAPGKLVAMTFTRKGAGEFAERILRRLAKGAADAGERKKLETDLRVLIGGDKKHDIKGLAPGVHLEIEDSTLQQALAVMVDEFDRLVLGTIDSFMSRSVQTLAFELGLDGFEILEEPAAEREQEELLQEVFQEASDKSLADFFQVLKLASLKSASSLQRQLQGFVDGYHSLLHSLPKAESWGGTAFWKGEPPRPAGNDWQKQALDLLQQVEGQNFGHKTLTNSLVTTLKWLSERNPGTAAKPPTWLDAEGKFPVLWANWPEGDWQLEFSRKQCTLPASVMRPLQPILAAWLAAESAALADKTKAIYEVVSRYEELYDRQARRKGHLAFDDLPLLLDGTNGSEAAQAAIELLAFRWFQHFDHWLLDEFQDTSRVQWEVLKPWLDEAIQDNSGTKSVFVVGDPKQSIYGWRGGEPRLFDDLSQNYHGAFDEQVMAESWRSRPAVLELVNRVCNPAQNPALQDPATFCPPALLRWRYAKHVSEKSRCDHPGYAALLLAPELEAATTEDAAEEAAPGNASDKLAAQATVLNSLLGQVDPLGKGLSCAILVRKNSNAQAIAQWLRAHDVPNVMVEGDATLADQSPVVAALVDGLRWLETPAHTLAGGHIRLTPLWEVLQQPLLGKEKNAAPVRSGSVWRYWRNRVSELGAAEVTRAWCRQLQPVACDAYSQYCLRQVDQFAHQAGLALALPDWRFSLERFTVRETAAPGSIHVMTIHKAKGLGFDVVFLPDLDLGGAGADDVLLKRDDEGRAEGCLVSPPKWLRAWVPELEHHKADQEADQDLEVLCVLYVALTRAKEATFAILQKEKPRNASRARDWLLRAVGAETGHEPASAPGGAGELIWEEGSLAFLASRNAPDPSGGLPEQKLELPAPLPRRERRRPSEAAHHRSAVSQPPPSIPSDGAGEDFGIAVHKVFEQIEWWQPGQSLQGPARAVAAVQECLKVPEIHALFTPESAQDEACRELPMELLDKNTWWSGLVDRLVLRRTPECTLRKALLLDFKTDKVNAAEDLRARYAEQLKVYRLAVTRALHLAPSDVETVLVSTHLRGIVRW